MHSQHNHIYVLFFYIPWLWDRIVISTQISVCVLATLTHSLTHTHSFLNVHAHQTLTSIEHIQNRFSWNDLFHWPTVTLTSYQWKHIWLHQLHSTSKTSVTAPCSHHCLLAPPRWRGGARARITARGFLVYFVTGHILTYSYHNAGLCLCVWLFWLVFVLHTFIRIDIRWSFGQGEGSQLCVCVCVSVWQVQRMVMSFLICITKQQAKHVLISLKEQERDYVLDGEPGNNRTTVLTAHFSEEHLWVIWSMKIMKHVHV